MYRIDNSSAIPVMPIPAVVGPNPNSYFTKGNPATSLAATVVDDDWLNSIQEEIAYVIEHTGGTLNKTNRSQLFTAIQTLLTGVPFATTSSSPNTFTASLSPAPAAYTTGMICIIKFTTGNTDAATLNLNALGVKTITRLDGSSLVSGDIQDGAIAIFVYDGTNFQLLNPFFDNSIPRGNLVIGGHFGTSPWTRGTTFPACLNTQFTADRFQWTQSSSAVVTISKDTSLLPSISTSGVLSTAVLKVLVTTADAAVGASDFASIRYPMEGYDFIKIAQRKFVISFDVYSTVTGTYTMGLSNSNGDQIYAASFTVNASNTWQKVKIVVSASPGAGTWRYDNGLGLDIRFVLMAGSNFTHSANTWIPNINSHQVAASGQVNALNATNNVFAIDQLKIEPGINPTLYDLKTVAQVEYECQRYAEKSYCRGTIFGTNTDVGSTDIALQELVGNGHVSIFGVTYKTPKRDIPLLSIISAAGSLGNVTQDTGTEVAANILQKSTNNYTIQITNDVGRYGLRHHYFSDAELY